MKFPSAPGILIHRAVRWSVQTQPLRCFEVLCSIEGYFNVTECDDSIVWSYSIIEDGSLNG